MSLGDTCRLCMSKDREVGGFTQRVKTLWPSVGLAVERPCSGLFPSTTQMGLEDSPLAL